MNVTEKGSKGACMRCMYGLCKSDSRTKAYKEHNLFYFIRFPKPCLPYRSGRIRKADINKHFEECSHCLKCKTWVEACGRIDAKFDSIDKVTHRHYICSLHFMGESGPSEEFPNPIKLSENVPKSVKPSKARRSLQEKYQNGKNVSEQEIRNRNENFVNLPTQNSENQENVKRDKSDEKCEDVRMSLPVRFDNPLLPKCKRRRKQCLEILNLPEEDFQSDSTERQIRNCSTRFSPDSNNFTYRVPRLRDDALPQLKNSSNKKKEVKHGRISANEAPNMEVESSPEKTENPVCDVEEEEFTKNSVNESPESEVEPLLDSTVLEGIAFNSGVFYFSKKCTNSQAQKQGDVSRQTCQSSDKNGEEKVSDQTGEIRKVDRATSVSPERIMNCPTKEAIRNYYKKELENEKKARRNMYKKLYLSQIRNARLQAVIYKLKSKVRQLNA